MIQHKVVFYAASVNIRTVPPTNHHSPFKMPVMHLNCDSRVRLRSRPQQSTKVLRYIKQFILVQVYKTLKTNRLRTNR